MTANLFLFKATIGVDADIVSIWNKVKHFGNQPNASIHLTGSNRKYVITYTGNWAGAVELQSFLANIPQAEPVTFTLAPTTTNGPLI